MSVVVLSGGVGGARFVRGLVDAVDPGDVTVIGNVGDDLEVLGMHVSPDLDSILYALARSERRGARLGPCRRDVARARRRSPSSAASRGSGSAIAISGCTSCARRRCNAASRSRRSRRGSPRARARHAASARDGRPPADVDHDAGGRVHVPGMVRRARPSRRGRCAPIRGSGGGGAGAAACSRRSSPPSLLLIAPSNPYVSIAPILALRAAARGARAPERAVRRGQPADRRPRGEGPRRPHARAARRRHVTRARGGLLRGPDRRARRRRGGRGTTSTGSATSARSSRGR